MSALSRKPDLTFLNAHWQADVQQLLDEHHLAAWSDAPQQRLQFGVALSSFLASQRDAEVCAFYGKQVTDLEAFCSQLERALPGPLLERRIHGPRGVVALLRNRDTIRSRFPAKYRYYIWHDADVLLRSDASLFGQLADAISGVAAESEFVSDDLLLIHRCVYIGSSVLATYAENPQGQFQSWLDDGQDEAFWKVLTGVDKPEFLQYRIEQGLVLRT